MGMGRINRGHKTVYFTFALIILALLPTMGYPSQDVINVSKNPYKIGPSDLLDIQVWNEPDVSKQVRVLIDGTIVLPLVGQINAAGLTPSQLSESLRKKLSEYIAEPEVTVMVLEGKYNRYFIVGQIQNPGEYYIDYPISILQAIARAGGFQEWAKKSKIFVIRQTKSGEERIEFNYDEFVKGDKKVKNLEIVSGDTIIIP